MIRKIIALFVIFVLAFGSLGSLPMSRVLAVQPLCFETIILDQLYPVSGATIKSGSQVGFHSQDETPIDQQSFYIKFGPAGGNLQTIPHNSPAMNITYHNTPGSKAPYANWMKVLYTIPKNLNTGKYEVQAYVEDTDQSHSADCAYADWTFNVQGVTPNQTYSCSSGQCNPDPNGTFTDPACGGQCTAPPPTGCSLMSVSPDSFSMSPNTTLPVTINITPAGNQNIQSVNSTVGDPSLINFGPISKNWQQANVTSFSNLGTTIATVTATLSDNSTCSDSSTITVANGTGWWQADLPNAFGDIFGQNLKSSIPSTCTLPSCVPNIDLGFSSSTLVYSSNPIDSGNGSVNPKRWFAITDQTQTMNKYSVANYWMPKLRPISQTYPETGVYNLGDPAQGDPSIDLLAVNSENYYYVPGDLRVIAQQNVSNTNATVFLVNGNLYINKVIVREDPRSFLAFFVTGNIYVSSSLGLGVIEPVTDGVFVADGIFDPGYGSATNKVYAGNGTYVAFGGFNMDRNLNGNKNAKTPSEYFTFDPSLVLNAPAGLLRQDFALSEIAPQ